MGYRKGLDVFLLSEVDNQTVKSVWIYLVILGNWQLDFCEENATGLLKIRVKG